MGAFYDLSADLIRGIYDRRIVAPTVLDIDRYFPDARKFVSAWREIRDEGLRVADRLATVPRFHEIMHEQTAISANDGRDWRMLILKAYGIENPINIAKCPVLASIVASAPDVLSASISFLAPGKHVPAHRGPFRGVLRFYLALSMPKAADGLPGAVLKIAGSEFRLSDGEYLLWDDTYVHEAWNCSDGLRMVLLLDVRRRGMPLDMEIFSRVLMMIVRIGIKLRGFS
jgi:aspartate beta-hydroxylase